jgi:indole-3-glycerol phosphate synthase
MSDYLDLLSLDARKTVEEGYYQAPGTPDRAWRRSLKQAILECRGNAIISEVKLASPSSKTVVDLDVVEVASAMSRGGAVAISVLTENKHFKGSLQNLTRVHGCVSLPVLMKDFVICKGQVEAAAKIGADAILLIQGLFDRKYCEYGLDEMIKEAHSSGLEVLLEAHTQQEFSRAVQSKADLVGINNRDLRTLKVDVNVTKEILRLNGCCGHVIVSESGIRSPNDIRLLREAGVKAFLVGSAIMMSGCVEEKVRELKEA